MIKVIHIEADLEYDPDMFHDDSEDEWDWFKNDILNGDVTLMSWQIGDDIGKIKDLKIIDQGMKEKILSLISKYGGYDGGHHKQWLLDEIVRELTGEDYEKWVRRYNLTNEGPEIFSWDEGIAP